MSGKTNKVQMKNVLFRFAPAVGLLVMFAVFLVLALTKDINLSYSFRNILNQSAVVIIVSTGAIFIYTLGSFDISLGASMCVSALLGAMVYNRIGSLPLMLAACIVSAVIISLTSSMLASFFNIPVFVTTVAMMSLLNALILVLIGLNGTGEIVQVPAAVVAGLNTVWFKLLAVILFLAFCIVVFNYLKFGRQEKFVGGNPVCAALTGLDGHKLSITAFVLAGLGVGLGAFLTIVYAPTLSRNTAGSVGMDVIISIVFGGMPVSGGARSRISAAVTGALSMTLLSQIILMLNLNTGISQMIKAIIFLAVVYISMAGNKRNILPR